ncbi:Hydrophobin-like protein MPG1 [Fonsecaea pedrosoi]|nr:Hydrophobin-like protein MPG1 [Fonsecaea pedrosoi]
MYTLILVTLAATGVFAGVPMKARGMDSGSELTVDQASNQCGNGQVISCCNTSTSSGDVGGLLSGSLNGLLGGSCSPIPVNVLGVQVPLQQACGNNQAACCTGDQTGLVNVQCTPIGL